MVLRRITVDKSVIYIPKSELIGEIKQNTIKNKPTPRKQNESIPQNNKKFLKKDFSTGIQIS